MPLLKTYGLFISHAWRYGDEYQRLVGLLDRAPFFAYQNYSAPKDKPIIPLGTHISKAELSAHLERKIRPVNIVLVVSGMYYLYHEWMQMELSTAQRYGKPIIAVKPWGGLYIPREVRQIATQAVGWNTSSILSAIRRHAI